MGYITVNDIKDKSINNAIAQANWNDIDLQIRINEAEAITDSYIAKAGYNKQDLLNSSLIKTINILLSKYNVLRDLYANVSPTKVEDKGFTKWKEEAIDLLEKIKNHDLILTDSNGNIISYDKSKFIPLINTDKTKRIFKIGREYTWSKPDYSYSNEDVIGEK
ncbi:MAG TPA: hypothetical protein PK103_09665 [Elusimicrobiales bacterium]|nr:hypothetical protein [Elusimicrobiales bacterium]